MDKVHTRSNPSLGWDPIREALDRELPCLAIAWSREEPDRAGEVTPLDDRRLLGRGPPQADDPAPRVTFLQLRPWGGVVTPPLQDTRISRIQLVLSPLPDGAIG